jgi:hypothetical protein
MACLCDVFSNVSELLSDAQSRSLQAKMKIFNVLETEASYSKHRWLLSRIFVHNLLVDSTLQYSQKVRGAIVSPG